MTTTSRRIPILRLGVLVWTIAVSWILAGCSGVPATSSAPKPPPAPLILISMDAFRWDYIALHPAESPHLTQLKREGISAENAISVYPSNTFPNHYSIVTGLYPSHHGIVNNDFFDPRVGTFFHYNVPATIQSTDWWGGEPIWVTAEKQGRRSASSFWVGSDIVIQGKRPNFWRPYDGNLKFEPRLEELMGWLRLPPAERPAIITFYLEETNSVGHKSGPDSPELAAAIKLQDDRIGTLLDRLKAENLTVNLLFVSDHGMTAISSERVIIIDDYVDPATVQLDFDSPAAGLRPLNGDVNALMKALAPLKHGKAYRVENLPAHFHISENPRNPPVWIVADEGWEIMTRARFAGLKDKLNKGDHGYDNQLTSMRGILIAHGPAFKTGGKVIPPVENIHVYNLMCAVLGLKPAPNDGDDRLVRAMLR